MKLVGRYQIMSRIGQGAVANVFRAYDPEIQRELAIKILNQQFRRDPECVARFLREARAAGSLSHPNIVTIYDVGEANGFPYIAMELLNGQPLDKAMAARGAFSTADTLRIGGQLAEALRYAHGLGVIHRDIKPSNIMLSEDGQTVKILDFGIARVADREGVADAEILKTQVGQVLGTPRYMSPEQALGQPLDGRSDLFSVGVVLYELVAGKPAFDGSSVATLALQITSHNPPPITVVPECPKGLRFIIEKLLAKRPERRFANGEQLVEALRREAVALSVAKEDERNRRLPLHLRFTLLAAACVALVLSVSIVTVLNAQYRAMERVAITSGSSIAAFVASNAALYAMENAARPENEGDWLPVRAFVKTASADPNITSMTVIDKGGVIRADVDATRIGSHSAAQFGQKLMGAEAGVTLSSVRDGHGQSSFRFTRPILYAGRVVGRVEVGVRKDELQAASSLSRMLLIGLGALTMFVVLGLSFLAGRLVLSPLQRLNAALREAAAGGFDFRISHRRRDEFGELFDNFNALVSEMQSRSEQTPPTFDPAATIGVTPSPQGPATLREHGSAAVVGGAHATADDDLLATKVRA